MGKKFCKILSSIIILMMVTTLFAACGSQSGGTVKKDDTTQVKTSDDKNGPAGFDNSKTLEISWFGFEGVEIVDGNPLQKELEEKFNVKIKNVKADIFNNEQINLMINSGEMPDASFMYQDPKTLYDKGVTRTIPKGYIEKYVPSFKKLLDRYPIGWLLSRAPEKEDEYMSLRGISLNTLQEGWVSYYRLDWLEQVGIKPKGELIQLDDEGKVFFTKTPFTLAEQEQVFDAFSKLGNDAKNPKYAVSGNKDYVNYSWETILSAHGLRNGMNLEEDGQYKVYYQSNKWKEVLKTLNNYYKKGYLDQEWTSQDLTKHWEKLNSGMVGWWPNVIGYINPIYQDRPPFGLTAKVPEAKILVTPPEAGRDGNQYFSLYADSPHAFNYNNFIGHNVDDEKLARILQIFEYVCFDKEAQIKFQYGFEGQHYTWQGEPYRSAIFAKADVTPKVKGETGMRFYQFVMYDEAMSGYLLVKEQKPIIDWLNAKNYKQINSKRFDVFGELADEYNKLGKQIGSDIEMIWREFYMQAIIGQVDIDAEWDNYLKRLDEVGIQKRNDIGKKAPLMEPLFNGEVKY